MMAVSALLMVGIRTPFHAERQEEIGGRMDGYRQLMADRWMRRLTLAWALIMVGVGPVIVAEVVLAHHFRVGSFGYGLISVFWDGGGVVGAILGVRLRAPVRAGGGGRRQRRDRGRLRHRRPDADLLAGAPGDDGRGRVRLVRHGRGAEHAPAAHARSAALARVGGARRGRARRDGRLVRAGRAARHVARRPGRVPGRVGADRRRDADARAGAAAHARAGRDPRCGAPARSRRAARGRSRAASACAARVLAAAAAAPAPAPDARRGSSVTPTPG